MTAALSANSSDTLDTIEKEFKAAQERVKLNLDLLPKNASTKTPSDAATKLLALGEGKTRVFNLRQKELAVDYGQTVLDETRKLDVGLGISVQQLVDGVQTETNASTWQARQQISYATIIMLALGVSDPDRLDSVRMARCRRQHPAPDRQPAAFDAAIVRRRSRQRDLSLQPARRDCGDVERPAHFPRKHDRGPRAVRRTGLRTASPRPNAPGAWRPASSNSKPRSAPRSTICRARPIPCRRPRKACRQPPTSPARWLNAVASAAEEASVNVQTVSSGTEELSSSIAEIGRQVVTSA